MFNLSIEELVKLSEKAKKDYEKFKHNGNIAYCCISDKTIFLVSQIMLFCLSEGINATISIKIKPKKEQEEKEQKG